MQYDTTIKSTIMNTEAKLHKDLSCLSIHLPHSEIPGKQT